MKADYLKWAVRHYGNVTFDLATSGVSSPSPLAPGGGPGCDDPEGPELLRAAIAEHHGVPINELIGALGASHGLNLALAAMLNADDEILVEHPTYEPLLMAAHASGATVRRFDRGESADFALDPRRILDAITPRTRVVAITNLHNPSGLRSSAEAMRAVAEAMEAQSGFLFVDEIYATFDDLGGPTAKFTETARHLARNVVTTGSLTKAYGLGPRRVGWVLGPSSVIERAEEATLATLGQLPLAWANDAAGAFDEVPQLAERTRTMLGSKRRRVDDWIAKRPSLEWSRPQEGLFGLVTVATARDLRPAIEDGIKRHDVIVAPGSFFGVPNAFRLSWSLPENMLDEALERLDLVLDDAA